MPDIQFLPLDDLADAPAGALPDALADAFADAFALPAFPPTDDGTDVEAAAAVRATHDGRTAALAGRWDAASAAFAASAARRAALVARGAAGPAVAARGWSDVAVLAAACGDVAGAADGLARARAADVAGDGLVDGPVGAALAEVAAWLDGQRAPTSDGPTSDGPTSGEPTFDVLAWEAPVAWAPEQPARPARGVEAPTSEVPLELPTAEWADPEEWAPWAQAARPAVADEPVSHALGEVTGAADTLPGTVEATAWPTVAADAAADPDVVVLDAEPSFGPTADDESPTPASAPDLRWLALEGPLRPWERPAGDTPADAAAVGLACAVPARPAPLAPPLAAVLRNAKVDEAVALATAGAEPRGGRLRSLLRRLRPNEA
jgi:hypothetical protein